MSMDGSAPARRTVLLLTGSQDLYGQGTLAAVDRQSAEIAQLLGDALHAPVDLVWTPVLTSADAIRAVIAQANADPAVIGVIAWMHTFSPAKMWISGLTELRKPLLHLHTQHSLGLDWGALDFDFATLNQSAHGDREFAYALTRLGIRRKTVVGHASEPEVASRIESWARAALGWDATRTLRIARFGDNMRFVAVTEGDKTAAQQQLGVEVNGWSPDDLADVIDTIGETETDRLVGEYDETYDIADELRAGGRQREALRYAAKQELALRHFLQEGGFRAFTTNFENLGRLAQLPGLAVQRLTADGYGFGAEGDWKSATLLRAVQAMGAGLSGGTSFMEDFSYDFSAGLVLGAHMLEVSPALTTSRPRAEIHDLSLTRRQAPIRLVFAADPGAGVTLSLTDQGSDFRIVASEVELVVPPEPLRRFPVAHAVWRPRPDLRTSAACWLMSGAAHHTALSTQISLETVSDYARMSGAQFLAIGQSTTERGFQAEVDRLQQPHGHR